MPFDLPIPLLGIYPKNPKSPMQKNLSTAMITVALFAIAKCWKEPKYPSVNELIKNYSTFTRWNILQQKERSSDPLRKHGQNWGALC